MKTFLRKWTVRGAAALLLFGLGACAGLPAATAEATGQLSLPTPSAALTAPPYPAASPPPSPTSTPSPIPPPATALPAVPLRSSIQPCPGLSVAATRAAPTPAFLPAAPAKVVSQIIFPYYPDFLAAPLLRSQELDARAGRQGLSKTTLDLGLCPAFPGPRLWSLSAAPGRGSLLAEINLGEGMRPIQIDMPGLAQALSLELNNEILILLGWGPGGQSGIFLTYPGPGQAYQLDLQTGQNTPIPVPPGEWPDYPPAVAAMTYSPNGSLLADALAYYPIYQKRAEGFLEIGLRPGPAGSRRVLCTVREGLTVNATGLAFSPDGAQLAWVTLGQDAKGGKTARLWLADVAGGNCRPLALLAQNLNYAHPPAWAPDGRWIAAVSARRGADGLAYEDGILLVDPVSGQTEPLPPGRAAASLDSALAPPVPPFPDGFGMVFRSWGISHLAWSPDGQFLAFTFSDGMSAEIRAVELATKRSFALAGPVPPLAPFVWIEK